MTFPTTWVSEKNPLGPPADAKTATPLTGKALTAEFQAAKDYVSEEPHVAVLSEAPINVEYPEYGADGTRVADSTAAIQAAIAALPEVGGGLYLPRRYRLSGQLDFESKRSIRIHGQAGTGSGLDPASQLLVTQSGTASPLNLKNTDGVTVHDLEIEYTSASFTGSLINCTEAFKPVVERVHLVGAGAASAVGINFDRVECASLRDMQIASCDIGIRGKVEDEVHSNVVEMDSVVFTGMTTIGAKNAGESWLFKNCTFEPLASGKAGAYTSDEGVKAYGLTFDTCWFGDANTEGTQLLLRGKGLTVRGGSLGSGKLGISVPDTTSDGLVVTGVRFISLTEGIKANFGAGTQRYIIGANAYESSVSGKKVSLDNGSTDAGAGFLSH
jgi:hypothetical protein